MCVRGGGGGRGAVDMKQTGRVDSEEACVWFMDGSRCACMFVAGTRVPAVTPAPGSSNGKCSFIDSGFASSSASILDRCVGIP